MKQSILAIFALAALLSYSHAQVTFKGDCPNVEVQPNFDLIKYQGIWYEHSKYPAYFEKDRKCVQGELTLKDDGNYRVNNSGINEITNKPSSSVGYAKPVENAKLKVVFPTSRPNNITSNYWVLSTDYTSYSVVYFCQPAENNTHKSNAWILARQRVPSKETVDVGKKVLTKNHVSLDALVVTDQNGCK